MGFFDGFAGGVSLCYRWDIRHQVVEQPWFGQQTTGDMEFPSRWKPPRFECPRPGDERRGSPAGTSQLQSCRDERRVSG